METKVISCENSYRILHPGLFLCIHTCFSSQQSVISWRICVMRKLAITNRFPWLIHYLEACYKGKDVLYTIQQKWRDVTTLSCNIFIEPRTREIIHLVMAVHQFVCVHSPGCLHRRMPTTKHKNGRYQTYYLPFTRSIEILWGPYTIASHDHIKCEVSDVGLMAYIFRSLSVKVTYPPVDRKPLNIISPLYANQR